MKKPAVHKKLPKDPSFEVCSLVVKACNEAKARDLTVFKTAGLSDLFNYQVIASGNSDRQVQGIVNKILEALDSEGIEYPTIEGLEAAHWAVVDCGDILVHVFYGPTREHYNLEGLWTKAPRLKLIEKKSGIELKAA